MECYKIFILKTIKAEVEVGVNKGINIYSLDIDDLC